MSNFYTRLTALTTDPDPRRVHRDSSGDTILSVSMRDLTSLLTHYDQMESAIRLDHDKDHLMVLQPVQLLREVVVAVYNNRGESGTTQLIMDAFGVVMQEDDKRTAVKQRFRL